MSEPKYKEPVVCLCCGKVIKNYMPEHDKNYEMIDEGVVGKLLAPFGSRFDGFVFQVAICDDCIDKLLIEKRVTQIADYITGEGYND